MKAAKFQQVITRVRGTFTDFTAGQRAVTIIAVIVAIVGGVVFYQWASKPAMGALYSQTLSQEDAAAITQKLTEAGVPYELNGNTVLIPRDKVDQTRLDMAAAGLPANTSDKEGYPLVENAPVTASDAQQRMLAKRATEGELKKAIEKMETISEANVQLALPEPDVFTRDQAEPKASVMVRTKPNTQLNTGQVESVVHLVAFSIPKLSPENVTVADTSGKLLSSPGASGGGAGVNEAQTAAASAQAKAIEQRLQNMLDRTVGPGNGSVAANVALNFDNTEVSTNEYVPPPNGTPPLVSNRTTERMNGSGNQYVGGVLGPDNIPVPTANGNNANSTYQRDQQANTNAVGTRQTRTKQAQGQPRKLDVSVMVNSRAAAGRDMTKLGELLATAAGVDTARQDKFSIGVMPFDTTADAARKAEQDALDAQQRQNELIQLAKNIGLGLLLLLALLIGFRKSRKKTTTMELGELESIETGPELPDFGGPAAIEGSPAEYELDGDELPVLEATPVDPQSEARTQARAEISKLVEDNPDEVARLLRGWMAERS